jgi:hypothetical protein
MTSEVFHLRRGGAYLAEVGAGLALALRSSKSRLSVVAVARHRRSGMLFGDLRAIIFGPLLPPRQRELSNAPCQELNRAEIQNVISNHGHNSGLMETIQELFTMFGRCQAYVECYDRGRKGYQCEPLSTAYRWLCP